MTEVNVPAKVPDSQSDWTTIDIFLFTNGQHYTPPRKYHLMTDQLNWWKNTLSYLAKSHFGSAHSIVDLYTTDGTKVATPLQLKHNTAYVAVIPPEFFINASYEKYLIKATRSWEKSQTKRLSNTGINNQEESQHLEGKSNSEDKEYESTNATATRDGSLTLKTIVASIVDDQISEVVKPRVDTAEKTTNIKTKINSMKQSEKLKRLSAQRPAFVNNINTNNTSTKSRKPSIIGAQSVKMKDCVKINTNSLYGRPSWNSNNKSISKDKILKPLHKMQELPEPSLSKVEESVKSSPTKIIEKMSLTKISEQSPKEVENEFFENESSAGSHFYNNPQSEKPKLSTAIGVNRQGGTIELFDVNYPAIIQKNTTDNENGVTGYNLELKTCKLAPDTSIISPKPENNVDYLNKEGTVNLKLNIELWNASSEGKYTYLAAKKESLCVLHTEKGSQIEIDDKTLVQHKILHKSIERELSSNEMNNKVTIVKCSCHNQCCNDTKIKTGIEQNNQNNVFRVNHTTSKILIFLPVLKLDGNCKRCDCNKEHKETNISNPTPVFDDTTNKTASCISLYKAKTDKITSHVEISSKNNSIEILNVEARDKNESTLLKRKSVAIREDIILPEVENIKQPSKGILDESSRHKHQEPSKVSVRVQEPSKVPLKTHEAVKLLVKPEEPALPCADTNNLLVHEIESTGRLNILSSNKSTQTEYCDVLVEARLQSDGHYSFHLPPLNIVKHYNNL